MFEKEAEEWWNNEYFPSLYDNVSEVWKEGAEFGYNKANEYVKDGDLPKHDNEVLVLLKDKTMQVDYYFSKVGWNISMNTDVIAWKEIVLPELKESE